MGKDGKAKPRPAAERGAGDHADEAALFRQAAEGAVPLRDDRGFVSPAASVAPRVPAPVASVGAQLEVGGSCEEISGAVPGLDARTRRRLRRGEMPIEARLDLHGLQRTDAERAVGRFLRAEQERGRRCVLVVTGRGLHSQEDGPVLKAALADWLAHGAAAARVLAFCSAKPRDGGAGACYVLLRRAGKV